MKICLHPKQFTCKKDAKLSISQLSKELPKHKTDCSVEELVNAIQKGQTFIPSIGINKTSRGNKHFKQSTLIGVDIDGTVSPTEALNRCENLGLKPCIGYYTFSQVDFNKANKQDSEKPGWNFRLLFKLEQDITDSSTYRSIASALIKVFGGDTACKDSMRIFYGSKGDSVFLRDDKAINAVSVLTKLVKAKPKNIRRQRTEQAYSDIESLPQFETNQLLNHLKLWQRKLIQSDDHRYNKLSNFIYSLMHFDFLTSNLVLDVVDSLISQDRKLREAYVDSWDKDYIEVAEQLVNWCERNYDERL